MSVNLGRVAFVAKGAYDAAVTYQQFDYVAANNGSYVYVNAVPMAGIPVGDTAYWQPLLNPEEMNAATQVAEEAAKTANSAAESANSAAESADSAAEAADNARAAIADELNKKAPAIFVDVSGDIVTITDGAEGMPVQSLITHVEPVQEGSGDPSPDNVRPISGWDSVSVTGTAENIFGGETLADRFESVMTVTRDDEARTISFSASRAGGKVFFTDFKPDTQYTVILYGSNSGTNGVTNSHIRYTDGTTQRLDFNIPGEEGYCVYTTTKGKSVESYRGSYNEGTTTLYYDQCGIFEGVLTEADFVEYQGKTLTAALPETLYGFDKNWTTGLVTVTHGVRVFTGNDEEVWKQFSADTPGLFYYEDIKLKGVSGHKRTSICSHFAWTNGDLAAEKDKQRLKTDFTNNYVNRWYVHSATYNDLTSWKAWLAEQYAAGTPVTLVYKLHAPYTIQLTPQQLETLKGTNNIWSNTGATEVTYAADTKMYADGKDSTAMIGTAEQGMIATKNYASGDFIVVGKSLYKASAAIATGEAITPGTNCTATTVVEQLAAIYNLLNA